MNSPLNPPAQASLEDHGFLIIGGSSGIGRVVAETLIGRGATVTIAARDQARLDAVASEIGARAAQVDATAFDDVDNLVRVVGSEGPRLVGVANMAGSILLKPAHSTSTEEWADTIAQNLTSAFSVVRAAGRHMKQGGSVVLMSSVAATRGLANHESIAAAKGGVSALARAAAASYATRGLRFNAVSPGLVNTPMSKPIVSNPTALEASQAMHPLRRIGEPGDVASAITWLLDPRNTWVTGQTMGIDGGLGELVPRVTR